MRIPHDLQQEFADEAAFLDQLIKSDHHVRKLAGRYTEINEHIYRIESEDEPTADEVLEKLKKQRLKLKDEIAASLTKLERRM